MGKNKTSCFYSLISIAIAALSVLFTGCVGNFWADSFLIKSIVPPLMLSLIFSIMSWWHCHLVSLKNRDDVEYERLRNSENILFTAEGKDQTLGAHALHSFDRRITPALTIIAGRSKFRGRR